ncbi:cytoplasmic protein [Chelativorans sp.]|uniref:cytoplasmic protein n=1 Tax=Chelativorans sp. TaxID=2203393 RepID=UPI002811F2DB|nr:cytoplasmic protein [Chelativorans sp.]
MEMSLQLEARLFRRAKEEEVAQARQCAAFFLISGIDLSAALETTGTERAAILARLRRLIERERLKGARRHWSYDLNRHIALKQAYDRLDPLGDEKTRRPRPPRIRRRKMKAAP